MASKSTKNVLFSGPFFGSFFWILLITENENLDSVLFFTALLRREQSLKMCFFGNFELFDHFGVQIEAKSGSKLGTKMGTSFFGILLITQDENLDFVLFFAALLRREQPPTKADI